MMKRNSINSVIFLCFFFFLMAAGQAKPPKKKFISPKKRATQEIVSPLSRKASQLLAVTLREPKNLSQKISFVQRYLDIERDDLNRISSALENGSLNEVLIADHEFKTTCTFAETLGYFPTRDPDKPIFLMQINLKQSHEYGSVFAFRYEDFLFILPVQIIKNQKELEKLVEQVLIEDIGEEEFADLSEDGYRLHQDGKLEFVPEDGGEPIVLIEGFSKKGGATILEYTLILRKADEKGEFTEPEAELKKSPFFSKLKKVKSQTWKIWLEREGDGIRAFGFNFDRTLNLLYDQYAVDF